MKTFGSYRVDAHPGNILYNGTNQDGLVFAWADFGSSSFLLPDQLVKSIDEFMDLCQK